MRYVIIIYVTLKKNMTKQIYLSNSPTKIVKLFQQTFKRSRKSRLFRVF